MKAVIYARYSSDNQREESIEGQIRECSAFAEKNGITILRHYIDCLLYTSALPTRRRWRNCAPCVRPCLLYTSRCV